MDGYLLWFFRIIIFLSIIPVQTILLEKVQIAGVKPDLALVWVFIQGWFWGPMHGLYWGLAFGGLLDFFSIGVLGIGFVLKGFAGFLAGIFGRAFLHLSYQAHLFILLLISFLHDISGTFFLYGIGVDGRGAVRLEEISIRMVYNALIGIGCILFIRKRIKKKGRVAYSGTIFPAGRSGLRR